MYIFFSIGQRWVLSGAGLAHSVRLRAEQPEDGAGRTKRFFSSAKASMLENAINERVFKSPYVLSGKN